MMVVVVLIVGCSTQKTSSTTPKSNSQLTTIEKQEICNDINAYYDYCELQKIDIDTCSKQAVEKAKRIYGLSDSQLLELSDYCW